MRAAERVIAELRTEKKKLLETWDMDAGQTDPSDASGPSRFGCFSKRPCTSCGKASLSRLGFCLTCLPTELREVGVLCSGCGKLLSEERVRANEDTDHDFCSSCWRRADPQRASGASSSSLENRMRRMVSRLEEVGESDEFFVDDDGSD